MRPTAPNVARRMHRPVSEVREAIAELVRHWGRPCVHGPRPQATGLTPAAVAAIYQHFGQRPPRRKTA